MPSPGNTSTCARVASVAEVTPLQVRDRKDLLMQEDVTQELLDIDNEAEMCYNENFRGDDEVRDT
jgi:hypothetical protein